jgi:hypothetical protein
MSSTPQGFEVRYLQAYLQLSAQYDPARFAGAAEAVLVYVADLEAHTPVYQPQAFRGFAMACGPWG